MVFFCVFWGFLFVGLFFFVYVCAEFKNINSFKLALSPSYIYSMETCPSEKYQGSSDMYSLNTLKDLAGYVYNKYFLLFSVIKNF